MIEYFIIGFLSGQPYSDHFLNRELCEGKVVVLKEKGFIGKCDFVDNNPPTNGSYITPYLNIVPNSLNIVPNIYRDNMPIVPNNYEYDIDVAGPRQNNGIKVIPNKNKEANGDIKSLPNLQTK
jgi:hypothetical protein